MSASVRHSFPGETALYKMCWCWRYSLFDGVDFKVGYLPKHLAVRANAYNGLCARVVEIYSAQSEVADEQQKFYCNKGCSVVEIIDIQSVLGLNDEMRGTVMNDLVGGDV